MRKHAFVPVFLLFAALAAAPASAQEGDGAVRASTAAASSGEIVFPPPPDKPRVRFLRSIENRADLTGREPGFFSKIVEFFTGGSLEAKFFKRPYGIWVRYPKLYATEAEEGYALVLDLESGEDRVLGATGADRLMTPIGIAASPDGRVFVSDTGDHSVKAYSPEGKLLWKRQAFGDAGPLKRPTDLAWSRDGEVLVLDTGNKRVIAFTPEGELVRVSLENEKKDPGALPVPTHLWVDPDGGLAVTDPLMARVHLFGADRGYAFGFGEKGNSPGYMMRPKGVAADSDGNLYVVDAVFNHVQIFDRRGRLLLFFGGHGVEPGQFALPADIFIDEKDRIYIVDSQNARVQILQYISYPDEKEASAGEPAEAENGG